MANNIIIMNEGKSTITSRQVCEYIPTLLTEEIPADMKKAITDFCAKTIKSMDANNANAKKKQTESAKVAMEEAEKLYSAMLAKGVSMQAKDWMKETDITAIVGKEGKAKFAHRMGILAENGKVEISRTTKTGANWYRAIAE